MIKSMAMEQLMITEEDTSRLRMIILREAMILVHSITVGYKKNVLLYFKTVTNLLECSKDANRFQ